MPTFEAIHFGRSNRQSRVGSRLGNIVGCGGGDVLFRSMCGTMHVPLYQVNSIEITSPPLRRQSRLRIQSVTLTRGNNCSPLLPSQPTTHLSTALRPQSCPLTLALSPQYLNTALASPALLPPRWHSPLVDMKAGSAAYDQLAGGRAQVEPTRRRAIGKLPHQASLCLKLCLKPFARGTFLG